MIILEIIYGFLIIYSAFFIVFWTGFKFTKVFRGSREIVEYLCLNHSWVVFSDPYKINTSILINIEYYDGEKELIKLFDCENMKFLNRKSNTYDKKYANNMMHCLKLRTIFIYQIKNKIEQDKNKKIKKIEYIEENKKIKLWESNLDLAVPFKATCYNF